MFLKFKLIFRFIKFVLKNEIIDKRDKRKNFTKFNLNSKTYLVENIGKITVENPLENLSLKGYIIQYEVSPDVWSDRFDRKFYRSYESASEAIINIKKTEPFKKFKIKPIYTLNKEQTRELDINALLGFS